MPSTKARRKSGDNRRMTELDEERKSRGKSQAAEKGLKWTKNVPKEGKAYVPKLRDDSHMADQEVGFLDIGKAAPTHAYDVGGEWKLLYKKPAAPIGPGIKPRESRKVSPPPPSPPPPAPPMEISVREPYRNKKHVLRVEPTDTIDEIKDRVEDKTGIPKKDQVLTFDGRPLDNDRKTLDEYGIQHQDTLDLEPMEIKVRTPDGRVVDLIVDPEDTIDDVKKQVKKKLGIPPEHQRPTFNGKPLPDNSTLEDNGIHHGDVIDLQPMQIKVRAPDGRTCDLDVSPDDTIPDIKNQVEKKLGIPAEEQRPIFNDEPLPDNSTLDDNGIKHGDVIDLEPMQINVRAPDGRTTQLSVSPDDPIDRIKKRVKKKLGIPTADQRPTFNGNPLPDESTLRDNDIQHGDTIDLSPMEIKVRTPDGRVAELVVTPDDTIDDVKDKVEYKLGIAPEDQRPSFKGKRLPDKSTLNDNDIHHGDTIDLEPMEIQVKTPDGRISDLVVNPYDLIKDVKKQVEKQLGIPVGNQRPTFDNEPLPDKSTLKDNNIRHGDMIELQPMEIYVIDLDGNKGTYQVNPLDTIEEIKSRVEDKTGVDRNAQRLSFEGTLLEEDNDTLKDVGIEHRDTLKLEPFTVHIRLPGGKKISMDVNPKTTSPNDLKNIVKKREGIMPSKQILKLGGKELDDPSSLEENGVQHNDVIDLRMAPPPVKLTTPEIKRDFRKALDPDRYGTVTVTTYKTRYDGEPGESFIDGEIKRTVTDFKFEKPILNSDQSK